MKIKNITSRKRLISLFAIILTILVIVLLQISPAEIAAYSQQLYAKAMKFNMVLDKIERFYVDNRRAEELVEDAIHGMLSHLDPHSIYLSAESYRQFKEEFEGFYGIGIKYDLVGDHFIILSVVEHSPAFKYGLQQGDKIFAIDGVSTEVLRYGELVHKLNGPPNTSVQLIIHRNGWKESREYKIPREKISVDSIPSVFMLKPEIGFIKIARFTSTTADELDIAFAQLRSEGMQSLILDLRDNTGGSLSGAEKVADRFIAAGKMIVYTKGRTTSSTESYVATEAATLPICPLVILVNGTTASGAEIVAGAVQDWDRGLIVGETTFGKALIQSEFPFQDGSALLLTTARYYTPLGRMIQREYGNDLETDLTNFNQKNKSENVSKRPQYKTPAGRLVYGGGSIIPDIFIPSKQRKFTPAVRRLCLAKDRFFFIFADKYLAEHPEVSKNLEQFVRDFRVTKTLYGKFANTVVSSGFEFSATDFHNNATIIKYLIKQELSRRIWGEEGAYRVALSVDSQLAEVAKYMDKAAVLIRN